EDNNSKLGLRSKVLKNNTFLKEGEYYSLKDLRKTYERFGRLQAVKYTNISFRELPYGEQLDCDIYINTNKANTISFQPEGTNTAGDLGAAVRLEYMNRNLFKGSELLSIDLRGAYEAITGLEGYNNDNFEEYTVETSLMFPRFIAPFLARSFRRRINATSEVALMYDLQNRPEYHRRVLSGAWRYKWNDANHHDRYQIDLLDINYVFMPWISDKFREDYLDDNTNRNAILRYNYEDLLIMKFGFRYSYNNGLYAIRANIETAGNVLGAISNIANLKKNELGQNKIFNIAYAQYVKGDFDYTKYFKFDETNTLVFHTGLGIAYPYDNSTILPFEKRYFSGGANSVRGWSVRSLGPGRYVGKDGNIDFINQTGDIKLDLNLEYRTHLFWKLDGALFVDAGNIWTFRDYKDQPGGQFDIATFYEQLAVSYGLGFRFNFDFFILRFDMGMKAIDPAYTGKDHYPILKHKMSRDFAFHFAVGMPF
ncbi:MAG: BamA/TamA family outer membrane protein, partial [Prevotella sp.]|nr:BamA/TamA family outer membrane protein [Prevotella sp.]